MYCGNLCFNAILNFLNHCRIDRQGRIKVAYFGLSESIYNSIYLILKNLKEVKLPVKWTAPESISDGVYSEKTDMVAIHIMYFSFYYSINYCSGHLGWPVGRYSPLVRLLIPVYILWLLSTWLRKDGKTMPVLIKCENRTTTWIAKEYHNGLKKMPACIVALC